MIYKKVIAVLMAGLILACEKNEESNQSKVEYSKETKSSHIQTATVKTQEVADIIEATGNIQPDKEGLVKINSKLAGNIQFIKVQVGDYVKKGDVLAIVKAPDTTDLYSQKVSLEIQLAQAHKLYNLKKQLYEVGAIPKTELMDAQTNYEVLKAQLKGIEERLKILGAGMGQIEITAPKDGVVYQINSHVGDYVDSSVDMIDIVDPSKILVVGQIQDKDAFKIKKGDDVEFSISLFPEKLFKGKVTYVSDVIDPETRIIKVFIKPEEINLLKINMFFNIKIYTGKTKYAVIPKTALLYEDGKFYVLLLQEGKIRKTEVSFVKELDNNLVAIQGINEGQTVITNPMVEESP